MGSVRREVPCLMTDSASLTTVASALRPCDFPSPRHLSLDYFNRPLAVTLDSPLSVLGGRDAAFSLQPNSLKIHSFVFSPAPLRESIP